MPTNALAPRTRVATMLGFMAAVLSAALFGGADAAIVRGSAGTSGDNQGGAYRLYITSTTLATGSVSARQQDWTTPVFAMATPETITVDQNGTPTTVSCSTLPYCSYAIGPTDSRTLSVTGAFQLFGTRATFPVAGVQVAPQMDVTWTVARIDRSVTPFLVQKLYTKTFSNVPYTAVTNDVQTVTQDLDLSTVPAGSYSISVEFAFTVPTDYAIYQWLAITGTPPGSFAPDPDIRTLGDFGGGTVSLIGRKFSMFASTSLEIAESDDVAPTSSLALSPAANAFGWNRTPVTGTVTATDTAQAGIDPAGVELIAYSGTNANPVGNFMGSSPSSPASFVVDTEGVSSLSWYSVDKRGNEEAPRTSVVRIDYGKPQITATVAPAPTAEGWNSGTATVSFTCADALSGIDTCTSPVTISTPGAGQQVAGTATDRAGNVATTDVVVNVDATPPTIAAAASPLANTAGWNNGAVTVSFTCADPESGIRTCTSPVVLSGNGANQSATGAAVNRASLSASTTLSGISIDTVAPSVAVTGVTNGATYVVGSVPTAGCSATDALSGVAATPVPSTSGAGTNGVGSVTTTCTATDRAGNTASASVGYRVTYAFQGFFQPVDNAPVVNRANAGRAIPVKFGLGGNFGLNVLAAGSPAVQQIACNTGLPIADIEETVTAGGSSLSYDAASGVYSYVWKTSSAFAGSCRMLILTLNDGTSRTATFQFR